MRPAALLFAIACLAALSALGWTLGVNTTDRIERTTYAQAKAALNAAGGRWAGLEADGLIVRITGEAPDEAEHLRAIDTLGQTVSAARIEDMTTVAPPIARPAPKFRLEILRSGGNISLIGDVPADPGPTAIAATAVAARGITNVTNLLEPSDAAAPAGWADAVAFSLYAMELIPRGRIVLQAGTLSVTAATDSFEQKQVLEDALAARVPQRLALALDITAPPPVIAPFEFSFSLAPAPRLAACTASTPEGRARILRAVRRAGATGPLECRIGLGTPSLLWPRAVDLGIAALERMGGGGLDIVDTELTVTAAKGLSRDAITALGEDLNRTLPAPFSLRTILPDTPSSAATATPALQVFIAELTENGSVHLTGPVHDATSGQAIMTYGASLFGFGKVTGSLAARTDLPEGWPGRVLTGIETLSLLKVGRIEVTADTIAITGRGDSEHISLEVRDVLRLRLGSDDGIAVNVRFDPALVPPEKPALHPAQCEIRIATLLETGQITFAPNEVEIEPDSIPIIDAIAGILRQCPQTRFEIGGHTDSQGREVLNLGLSQSRADAVHDALLLREVLIAELTARGYGESQPVSTNQTEEGRQKNRRIAFKLLGTMDEPD